jgi:hypothetical protein
MDLNMDGLIDGDGDMDELEKALNSLQGLSKQPALNLFETRTLVTKDEEDITVLYKDIASYTLR